MHTIGPLSPQTTLLGRYRLERLLGTGGMASVWLASDEALARPVAVKIIADTLAADPVWVRRFQQEARAAASLNHPNVVPVFDSGTEHGRPFLVMQYVAGGTLAEELRDGGAPNAERIARQLLDAVRHIHRAGLLHRDIKPANVLLDGDGRARLTDFGVAQREGATRLTSTGNVLGTARYLAPEVLAGEPATPRSDLFACGRLLEDVADKASQPRALARLIDRLTAEQPSRRPESAEAALRLLDDAGTAKTRLLPREPHPPTSAPPTGTDPRTPRTVARRAPRRARATRSSLRPISPAGLLAALLVSGLIILLVALISGGGHSPAPAPAPAKAPIARQIQALEQRVRYAGRR